MQFLQQQNFMVLKFFLVSRVLAVKHFCLVSCFILKSAMKSRRCQFQGQRNE